MISLLLNTNHDHFSKIAIFNPHDVTQSLLRVQCYKHPLPMKSYNQVSCRKIPLTSFALLKGRKNILLATPYKHKIILNKGKDSNIDSRWHTRSIQIKVNTLNGTYHYYSKYLWNNYLIFWKADSNKKGTNKYKETAVNQNIIIRRNKSNMKLNYTELQSPLPRFFLVPILFKVLYFLEKQKFCNIPAVKVYYHWIWQLTWNYCF